MLHVFVDPEIITSMKMRSHHKKARLVLSSKTTHTMASLREAIERRFVTLTDKPYKLRYKLSRPVVAVNNSDRSDDCGNEPLVLLRDDSDVAEAMRVAQEASSSLQLFIQIAPGVFPAEYRVDQQYLQQLHWHSQGLEAEGAAADAVVEPQDEQQKLQKQQQAKQFLQQLETLHTAANAMRKQHIDPADAESFHMVSFYGFFSNINGNSGTKSNNNDTTSSCNSSSSSGYSGCVDNRSEETLEAFSRHLEYLWGPFQTRGRVSVVCVVLLIL